MASSTSLNRWLRGATQTSITSTIGQAEQLRLVKYVITLDADTILGRDSARRLVAVSAHPLNHAQADPRTGRVVHGYGLLQPRTEIIPASVNYSRFSRIFAGDIGLDLYTHAVSNVYQESLWQRQLHCQGIYDVDAFENSLAGRVPRSNLNGSVAAAGAGEGAGGRSVRRDADADADAKPPPNSAARGS